MSDWTDGYVVDVSYSEGVYREMTPQWLSLATLLNGQPPLDISRPGFTYLELGCGNGLTSSAVAATVPGADVWGFDFNPAHVERARQLAGACGLPNCHFEEASFDELARRQDLGPSSADVIALHGVFSWITEQNRAHAVDVIRQRLRPGGVAYISYSLATGWAMMVPLQEAMRLQVLADGRRSDIALRAAIATVAQLADSSSVTLLGPREQSVFDGVLTRHPGYAAHEYLGGAFAPLMFADVAAQLAGAKCAFVGGAGPADAVLSLRTLPGLDTEIRAAPDAVLRETLCDIAGSRMFRADVFRRGLASGHPGEQRQWIDDLVIVSTGQPFDPEREAQGPTARARLDEPQYRPVVERLALGPLTGAELRQVSVLGGKHDGELMTTVALLVAAGYAVPGVPDWQETGAAESTGRLNALFIDMSRRGETHGFLAAAGGGTSVAVDPLTALAIGELWDGAPFDEGALIERVAALGGTRPHADDAAGGALATAARMAIQLVSGPFVHLGVVAPGGRAVGLASTPPLVLEGGGPEGRRAGRVAIAPGVSWIAVDADIVVLDGGGRVHTVEGTGALIWPLLDGTATTDDLAADVADVFGVAPDEARADVDRFIAAMSGAGLVRPSSSVGEPMRLDEQAQPRRVPAATDPPPMAPPDPRWIGGLCLEVAGFRVGVRADEADLLESLRSVFGAHLVEASPPEDYGVSVARRGGAGPRMIPALLHGRATVLKSRSRPRILRRLDLALAELSREPDPHRLRMAGMSAVTSQGRAVLVPQAWVDRSVTEHALAGAGVAIAEGVALRLDVDTLDLEVEDGLLGVHGPAELDDDVRPRPGRHELSAIMWTEDQVTPDERRATAVARLARLVEKPARLDRDLLLTKLVELAGRCAPTPLPRFSADLSPVLAALG